MLQLISLIAGVICLIFGFSIPSIPLIVVGVILAAIGGVWIVFFTDDFDLSDLF